MSPSPSLHTTRYSPRASLPTSLSLRRFTLKTPSDSSFFVVQRSTTLARIRDNQRRSRARRKEYLADLETRYRTCEQLGVQASAEIQAAARRVVDENRRLRALLLQKGLSEAEIDTAPIAPADHPGLTQSAAELESLLVSPRACRPGSAGCEPGGKGCGPAAATGSTTNSTTVSTPIAPAASIFSTPQLPMLIPKQGTPAQAIAPAISPVSAPSNGNNTNSRNLAPSPPVPLQYHQYAYVNLAAANNHNGALSTTTMPLDLHQQHPQQFPDYLLDAASTADLHAWTTTLDTTNAGRYLGPSDNNNNNSLTPTSSSRHGSAASLPQQQQQQHSQQQQQHTLPPSTSPPSSYAAEVASCRTAADVISSVNPTLGPQEVEGMLGCCGQVECAVPTQRVFDILNRMAG